VDVTLHLVRRRPPPPGVVAAGDVVLHVQGGAWHDGAAPLTDEAVVALVFRAARVAVW
jgi:hypothetical protein